MACNRIRISASPEVVFDRLSNPSFYPRWVVGVRVVGKADPAWPRRASEFRSEMGTPRLAVMATTQSVDSTRDRGLVLAVESSLGAVDIAIDVEPHDQGTVVTLQEELRGSNPLTWFVEPLLHARNAESLRRLKVLIEGKITPASFVSGMEALRGIDPWFDRPGYRDVLAHADRCYAAVSGTRGPHVTPVAFAVAHGRVWVVLERASVKAQVLQRHPDMAILVRRGKSSVVVSGRARILDPRRPWEWPTRLVDATVAVPALVDYGRRNAARLLQYAASDPRSIVRLRPSARFLVSVAPARVALIEGKYVTDRRGMWAEKDGTADASAGEDGGGDILEQDAVRGLPAEIKSLLGEAGADVAVGLDTATGVIALPGRWDPARSAAWVPAETIAMVGATDATSASVCFDAEEGSELWQKKGVVLRGEARISRSGRRAAVIVNGSKASYWAGTRAGTVSDMQGSPT